jgi:Ca2+-transporting ATPase
VKEYLEASDDVLAACKSDAENGLTSDEAARRLSENGPNKLDEAKKDPIWKRLLAQMADPMIIMLLVAAVISAVTGMAQGDGDFADVVIILFVVVVNAVLGVVQESKAEEALEALQEMSGATSKVVRDGSQLEVKSQDLVVGDVIVLEAGDAVPADCRFIESATCKVEESALTGESVPVEKHVEPVAIPDEADDVPLGDRRNMCYMGSVVVYGRGRAVVVATGMRTEMGKIADSITQATEELTPLQVKLAELSKVLTILVCVICAVIFGVGFLKHGAEFLSQPELILDTFMVAVSLAVAAIPEGLVAVVTIVLSIGVTKMSHHNAIIRKLTAVETLGCTQLICSDKTGTLTQNKMTVMHHYTQNRDSLVTTMALCCDAKWDDAEGKAQGEPTEAALVADAAKHGFTTRELDDDNPRTGEAPFDSGRKMMSVVNLDERGHYVQHTKGAPDVLLARCTKVLTSDGEVDLTDELRAKVMEHNKSMADDALRVMAAARRDLGTVEPASYEAADLEHDLTFVGLSGMIDPVRPEVKAAIAEAHGAGIRVVMITGDHIDTAVAIAKELGIITDRAQATTGAALDRMDDEEFSSRIADFGVYARVQPEHKVRIVETWKAHDKVVAMTGDGVNDAPSIKRADIGIGMGITGTDVTKNVADMVLADDNFATIVSAVEEGRRIYDNIRKAIQFLLSSNLAEVIAVFVASLVGFTILEPTHLLWINLITDCFPALALGMEVAERGIMQRRPRDKSDGIFAGGLGLDCAFQGIVIAILTLVSYFIGHNLEYGTMDISQVIADPTLGREGMTMAFLTLSMVEMFHSFNMRSRRQSIFTIRHQNVWLWGSLALSLLLTWCVIEIDPIANAFGFAELSLSTYGVAMLLAFMVIPINEVYKAVMRRVERGRNVVAPGDAA